MLKKRFAVLLLILSSLLVTGIALAQDEIGATLTADPQQLTVGDRIVLVLSVSHPAGYRALLPALDSPWGDFDVQDVSLPQIVTHADGRESTTFTILATLFQPGSFTTPSVTVDVFDPSGAKHEVTADPVTLTVNSVLTQGDTTLRDIKGQADMPVPPAAAATLPLMILGVIAVLVLLVAGVLLLRRRRNRPAEVDNRPPYQVAFDELQRIQTLDLPAHNELGMYCDLISACLRRYVETEFDMPAMDRTTTEIKTLMRQSMLPTEQGQQLVQLLTQCDLVKFSGWTPGAVDSACGAGRILCRKHAPPVRRRRCGLAQGRRAGRMSFQFGSPWLLLFLLLIPLLVLLPRLFPQQMQPAGLRYSSTDLPAANPGRSWRVRFMGLPRTLRMIALALIVVGLARPQSVEAREVVHGQGVDIALALDISGSMASLDFKPQNRLEAAKQVISDFIKERPYDRIGLVVFASQAFNQSPMTVDHDVLGRLLDRIQLATDLGLEDGTAIGLGLANAANMLQNSDAKSKVVILLTDGVNNAGQIDPLTAAQAAATLGIKVYTIGAGRTGQVPVPATDMFGRQVLTYQESNLDETTLKEIAKETGGQYFRAEDTAGLQSVYDQINSLEKSDVEITDFSSYQELAGLTLIPALALLLVEMGLRQTAFRRIP